MELQHQRFFATRTLPLCLTHRRMPLFEQHVDHHSFALQLCNPTQKAIHAKQHQPRAFIPLVTAITSVFLDTITRPDGLMQKISKIPTQVPQFSQLILNSASCRTIITPCSVISRFSIRRSSRDLPRLMYCWLLYVIRQAPFRQYMVSSYTSSQ